MQINIFDDLILKESAADIGHLFTHLLYCELQILNAIGGDQTSQKVRHPQYYKQQCWVEVITLLLMCQHKKNFSNKTLSALLKMITALLS